MEQPIPMKERNPHLQTHNARKFTEVFEAGRDFEKYACCIHVDHERGEDRSILSLVGQTVFEIWDSVLNQFPNIYGTRMSWQKVYFFRPFIDEENDIFREVLLKIFREKASSRLTINSIFGRLPRDPMKAVMHLEGVLGLQLVKRDYWIVHRLEYYYVDGIKVYLNDIDGLLKGEAKARSFLRSIFEAQMCYFKSNGSFSNAISDLLREGFLSERNLKDVKNYYRIVLKLDGDNFLVEAHPLEYCTPEWRKSNKLKWRTARNPKKEGSGMFSFFIDKSGDIETIDMNGVISEKLEG